MTATIVSADGRPTDPRDLPTDASELLGRIRALVPTFRANAAQTERDKRVAAENVEAMRAAGLFRLTTPPQYGGYKISLPELLKIIFEAGRGCASTGWILANDAASTSFAYQLPEAALNDMFGDNPDALVLSTANVTGSHALRVDGGYTISGRFPWSSGCEISDWAYVAVCPLIEGDAEPTKLVTSVVPIGDMTVEQTWNCAGMSGTGTHTLIATDLFVPEHRTTVLDFAPENQVDDDERNTVLMRGSLQSLASLVGAAQGALDTVRELLAKKRPISYTLHPSAMDSTAIQLWYAEGTHLVDTAVLHMMHAGETLDKIGFDEPVPWVERCRIRSHLASSLARARDGVDKLLDVAGASGFAMSNPLQRYWRDLSVGSRHNALNAPIIFEDYGRALLDIRPAMTLVY